MASCDPSTKAPFGKWGLTLSSCGHMICLRLKEKGPRRSESNMGPGFLMSLLNPTLDICKDGWGCRECLSNRSGFRKKSRVLGYDMDMI